MCLIVCDCVGLFVCFFGCVDARVVLCCGMLLGLDCYVWCVLLLLSYVCCWLCDGVVVLVCCMGFACCLVGVFCLVGLMLLLSCSVMLFGLV